MVVLEWDNSSMSAQLRQTETFAGQLFWNYKRRLFSYPIAQIGDFGPQSKKDLSDAQDEKFGATKLLQKSVQAKEQPPPSICGLMRQKKERYIINRMDFYFRP